MLIAPVLTRGKIAELPQPAGIGVVFKVGQDKGMYVKALSPDGPAYASGLVQVDDLLMTVNGKDVFGKPVTEVRSMRHARLYCISL
jgi:C-terminal processing protease CtpA/Prc